MFLNHVATLVVATSLMDASKVFSDDSIPIRLFNGDLREATL